MLRGKHREYTISVFGTSGLLCNQNRAFPPMEVYANAQNAPYVRYSMIAEKSGEYQIAFYLLSRKPPVKGGKMRYTSMPVIRELFWKSWYYLRQTVTYRKAIWDRKKAII